MESYDKILKETLFESANKKNIISLTYNPLGESGKQILLSGNAFEKGSKKIGTYLNLSACAKFKYYIEQFLKNPVYKDDNYDAVMITYSKNDKTGVVKTSSLNADKGNSSITDIKDIKNIKVYLNMSESESQNNKRNLGVTLTYFDLIALHYIFTNILENRYDTSVSKFRAVAKLDKNSPERKIFENIKSSYGNDDGGNGNENEYNNYNKNSYNNSQPNFGNNNSQNSSFNGNFGNNSGASSLNSNLGAEAMTSNFPQGNFAPQNSIGSNLGGFGEGR